MRPRWIVLAVVVAALLGMAAGYLYRRSRSPSLEERVHDTADEVRKALEKATK